MKLTIDVPAPSPEAVEAYLMAHGWGPCGGLHPMPTYWHDTHGGLAIPQEPAYSDFDKWMGVAVESLARMEGRAAADVLRDINAALTVRTEDGARAT